MCKTEVTGRRLSFCSDECVQRWKERTNPTVQRRLVFARDRQTCQRCGLDVGKLIRRVERFEALLHRVREDRGTAP
jgi:hypothetical protein